MSGSLGHWPSQKLATRISRKLPMLPPTSSLVSRLLAGQVLPVFWRLRAEVGRLWPQKLGHFPLKTRKMTKKDRLQGAGWRRPKSDGGKPPVRISDHADGNTRERHGVCKTVKTETNAHRNGEGKSMETNPAGGGGAGKVGGPKHLDRLYLDDRRLTTQPLNERQRQTGFPNPCAGSRSEPQRASGRGFRNSEAQSPPKPLKN